MKVCFGTIYKVTIYRVSDKLKEQNIAESPLVESLKVDNCIRWLIMEEPFLCLESNCGLKSRLTLENYLHVLKICSTLGEVILIFLFALPVKILFIFQDQSA